MNNDSLATYETWDMTAPVVPPRSRLFHIDPVGLGTPLVECLTSYISRVAQAHSISPGALQYHEVPKYGAPRQNIFSCGIKSRARSFTAGINAIGTLAADFVSSIGKLTARNDLQYLTMIPWKSLFPTQMLMRGVAAWCPVCLASWEQAAKPAYVPLLWTLEVVKFCPYHRRPLRFTCPHCSLPQPVLGQCSWVGVLRAMQAPARIRFRQGQSGTVFGSPAGDAGVGDMGGEPDRGPNPSRVSR